MSGESTPPLDPTAPWSFVRGLQPGSFCDWPGRVCAVLFLGTCNLRCPTCHNASLAWRPEDLPVVPKSQVFAFLHSRRDWLDGVVISGGEPSVVPGLPHLLEEISGFGFPVKLDTNGLRPGVLRSLLQERLVQTVAVDVKGPWDKYPQLTGQRCSAALAEESMQAVFDLASESPEAFYFRCTAVPGLTPDELALVQDSLPQGFHLSIQTYVPPLPQTPLRNE